MRYENIRIDGIFKSVITRRLVKPKYAEYTLAYSNVGVV